MKKRIFSILALMLALFLSVPTIAHAKEPSMTVDEAREYLQTYNVTQENFEGKEYTVQYLFDTEENFEKASVYLSEKGLSAFNAEVEAEIRDLVSKESNTPILRTTSPTTAYSSVSGNGNHYVSAQAYGLASFDSLGTVEYLVNLGYRLTVSNGAFTNLTSISFDIPYISTAGSWGNTRFPSYCTSTNAGVTANYTITKSLQVGISDFSFIVKTETDNEIFSLLTSLN